MSQSSSMKNLIKKIFSLSYTHIIYYSEIKVWKKKTNYDLNNPIYTRLKVLRISKKITKEI